MAPALSQPLLLFCQAILLGMAAALLYDLLRAFRLRLPPPQAAPGHPY